MKTEKENIHKNEAPAVERTSNHKVFKPATDIFETKDAIVVMADLPGVQDRDLDITLDKNTLVIRGEVRRLKPLDELTPLYVEYEVGDFERRFILSNEINREGIEAKLANGVLRLNLPKAKELQPRKINLKTS